MPKSKFIVVEHKAKRAGLHHDIRFRMPNSKKWISFACRKRPPTEQGKKVMVVRTTDHTEKEALFVGRIETGYGAGDLKKWDGGTCEIVKFSPARHIVVNFKGSKLKGNYHFLSTGVFSKEEKGETYLFFKGKV